MILPLLTASVLLAAPVSIPAHAPYEFESFESLPRLSESQASGPHALKFNWARDGAITGVGAALWLGSEMFFKDSLSPGQCRWCDGARAGSFRLNPVDRFGRGLAGSTPGARAQAAMLSNVLGFAALPAGIFGMQYALARSSGNTSFFKEDFFIVLQSAVLSSVATQAVKFAVGRQRPFVSAALADGQSLALSSDHNLSFFSGHTSLAFSLAVSAGVVAEMRGYEKSWVVWAVGMPLAATVPLLRMRADRHYLTDVAMGAAVGSAFGVAVPLLLHGRQYRDEGSGGGLGAKGGKVKMKVSPMGTGMQLQGTF
jgi:membrane-associated phospholipid phosphatase